MPFADPPLVPESSRSTRDRPAKPPLSEAAVVDAALEILKREGLEAVTMRRVAAALDTGAASLYVYVAGREGLLSLMLDRVTASVTLEDPDPARWREQLFTLLARVHAALLEHPGLAALTLANPPTTEPILLFTENLLGVLLAGGLSPQDAAWTCDTVVLLVTGAAHEDELRHARDDVTERDQQIGELHETFAGLAAERFPLLTTYADEMVNGDGETRFRFALDVLLDGVVARSTRR